MTMTRTSASARLPGIEVSIQGVTMAGAADDKQAESNSAISRG